MTECAWDPDTLPTAKVTPHQLNNHNYHNQSPPVLSPSPETHSVPSTAAPPISESVNDNRRGSCSLPLSLCYVYPSVPLPSCLPGCPSWLNFVVLWRHNHWLSGRWFGRKSVCRQRHTATPFTRSPQKPRTGRHTEGTNIPLARQSASSPQASTVGSICITIYNILIWYTI